MTRKQRRLVLIGSSLAVLALAVALVLTAMRDSIVFFNSPTDVVEKKLHGRHAHPARRTGAARHRASRKDLDATFDVTDGKNVIRVSYRGILPDLFREGQGVVAEGMMIEQASFRADSVLAKHDETYMPKEVADALKKQGHWKDDYGKKPGSGAAART